MSDNNPLTDPNGTPEDVATLYSWANLHGAKYRDFSAARAQTREKARLRAEQAAAEQAAADQLAQLRVEAEASHAAESERAAKEAQAAELARQAEIEAAAAHQAEVDAQALREAEWERQLTARRAAEDAARREAEEAAAARQAEVDAQAAREAEWERQRAALQAAEEAARREAEQAAEAEKAAEAERAAAQARQAAEEAARAAAAAHQAEIEAQAAREAEQERLAELARQQAAQLAALHAAQEAARLEAQRMQQRAAELAAQQAAQKAAELAAQQAAQKAAEEAAQKAAQQAAAQAAQRAADQAAEQLAQQRAWQQAAAERAAQANAYYPSTPEYAQPQPSRLAAQRPAPQPFASPREESPRNTLWATQETPEPAGRPAWLTSDPPEATAAPAYVPSTAQPQAPEDTLQGSRDRIVSRWFALRGVFDGAPPPQEAAPPPVTSRAPAMAVFSLAGGVGKTSLVATLGRALSARGERVLLVDTAAFGLLPFFFGATDQRPGLLRTFNPPGVSADAPIQMVTLDPEALASEPASQESLSGEIAKFARGASRILIDLATASGATTRRIMRMSPLILVPVIADMNSVVSVSSIDAFFEHNSAAAGKPSLPYYVLNQFDATLPLHLDVREVLREQLGERLLPFALRRTPAMSEALAEGMTVMDYAPGSPLADDFITLAGWVKSLSAPATTSYRGVRWSER